MAKGFDKWHVGLLLRLGDCVHKPGKTICTVCRNGIIDYIKELEAYKDKWK